MKQNHVIQAIPPSGDAALRDTIFTQRFLPEFCGISKEQYDQLENTILSRSIREVFYPRILPDLYRDHRADIVRALADAIPVPKDSAHKTGLGLILYDDYETSFRTSFINGMLSVIDKSEEINLLVSNEEPNLIIAQDEDWNTLILWQVTWNAWDTLKNFVFLTERVKPQLRDGILL